MPNINAESLTIRKLWPMFKSRLKVSQDHKFKIYGTVGKAL